MRWSIIRLIWFRELRDQLRDRRTVFMIAVLPIVLYPLVGLGVLQLSLGFLAQSSVIGLVGAERLLPPDVPEERQLQLSSAVGVVAGLAGIDRLGTAATLALGGEAVAFPALLERDGDRLQIRSRYRNGLPTALLPMLRPLEAPADSLGDPETVAQQYLPLLNNRQIDLLVVVVDDPYRQFQQNQTIELFYLVRSQDENSRLVGHRFNGILGQYRRDLMRVRLARTGLPATFDQPIVLREPVEKTSTASEENLFAVMVRIFPFVLVMWALAGALYPAIDLCAGEKERGTMETLLISPASREEIVWGKFLTIWVFSTATALLNLLSMALTAWQFSGIGQATTGFRPLALFWAVLLLLPLSAFFSAVCLAIGAYARSSKEGQYYLMPLFLGTLPLVCLTLAPGVELNPFYSMVPVTGVALLLQRLMTSDQFETSLGLYFVPVLAPIAMYSWLALRWAIGQFQREEVLFREAERLDLGLWLQRVFREKEPLPTTGEALVCFALILTLRWVSFGIGENLSLLQRTGVAQLAFVAAPPLFMALLLTTRPMAGLALHRPPLWSLPAAVVLALLVLPPLAELTWGILQQFPALRTLLELNHPLTLELRALLGGESPRGTGEIFVVLALLPAVCEELAFRGFILQGLLRRFRPWSAILLSAFLFALYQMNVFQFVPHFLFGVVLGLLVIRSGSIWPAMLFHLVYNTVVVIVPLLLPELFGNLLQLASSAEGLTMVGLLRVALSLICTLAALGGLLTIWWAGRPLVPSSPGANPS